ncbi:MAG: hypothetical protein ACREVK_02040 [Gammaproteobacteria bacterium]
MSLPTADAAFGATIILLGPRLDGPRAVLQQLSAPHIHCTSTVDIRRWAVNLHLRRLIHGFSNKANGSSTAALLPTRAMPRSSVCRGLEV